MADHFGAMAAEIEEEGGTIEKFVGDAGEVTIAS